MNTPSPERATVMTTGLDVADETRSFTERLIAGLATQTPLYDAPDLATALATARAGGMTGGPRPRLAQARDRVVTSPIGSTRVRVLVPDEVTGVYLHLHGGGHTLGLRRLARIVSTTDRSPRTTEKSLAPAYR